MVICINVEDNIFLWIDYYQNTVYQADGMVLTACGFCYKQVSKVKTGVDDDKHVVPSQFPQVTVITRTQGLKDE